MYAHQVIDGINDFAINKVGESNKAFKQTLSALNYKIRIAQKFHLGSAENIDSAMSFDGFQEFFGGNDSEVIKLPFPLTYFDVYYKMPPSNSIGKTAVLLEEQSEELITAYFFVLSSGIPQQWMPIVFCMDLSVGVSFFENKSKYKKPRIGEQASPDGDHFMAIPLKGIPEDRGIKALNQPNLQKFAWDGIYAACFLFQFLACRNIETIDNLPPEKLNKKRKKKGKQPLFTYKTLAIKPTGKQRQSVPRHLWENRIHLCRGHFKTYTAEAPLFGKYTGRYWWQPSVRGRNKDGVVMKDYHVDASRMQASKNGGEKT